MEERGAGREEWGVRDRAVGVRGQGGWGGGEGQGSWGEGAGWVGWG